MPVAAIKGGLAEFQNLLAGTWSNQALPNATAAEGSTTNPLSYNVMPLPQATNDVQSFILKNSTVYEVIRFNDNTAIDLPTTAANRGEGKLQTPTSMYYEQQVYFGDGPGKGTIVHSENGSWLNLTTSEAFTGADPYQAAKLQNPNQQPADHTIAKQMSVPHGNSILALGAFGPPTAGAPKIAAPSGFSIFPTPSGLDTSVYTTKHDDSKSYQNPNPDWAQNPFLPLVEAENLIKPTHSINWNVTTHPLTGDPSIQGGTINIPFEERAVRVSAYAASYWLLSADKGKTYPFLAYAQNITLEIRINDKIYTFPHVTSNTLTKQS